MTNKSLKKMRESDIDAHLKRAFEELAHEGLPDRFIDLLVQLKSGDGRPNGRGAAAGSDEARDDAGDAGEAASRPLQDQDERRRDGRDGAGTATSEPVPAETAEARDRE